MEDNVIQFPIERTHLYRCHCGSPTRQDCYCFDRRCGTNWMAGVILLGSAAVSIGFWTWAVRSIFRVIGG